jgi:hypothetical protein
MEFQPINVAVFFWAFILYATFYYDKYPYIILLWIPATIPYKGTGFSSLIIVIKTHKKLTKNFIDIKFIASLLTKDVLSTYISYFLL